MDKWLDDVYLQKRKKNNIQAKILLSGDEKFDKKYLDRTKGSLCRHTQYKYLNKNINISNEINLYGWDKILISAVSENEIRWAIIRSKILYDTLDSFFDFFRKE